MIKKIGVIAVIAAVIGGVWFLYTSTRPLLADSADGRETVVIETGSVVSNVKATNRLEAGGEASLTFETPGVVAEIYVERGQYVEAGDPIARLDTRMLELQLVQAEANLAKVLHSVRPEDIASAEAALRGAEANYAKVAAGADAEDIAAAEATLRGAKANYNSLSEDPSDDEITVAAANLRNAEIALQNAQWAYDKVAYVDNIGEMPQAAELQRATISYESALAGYHLAVQGADSNQLQAGWSQVEQAQAQLDKLTNGPTLEDLIAAQAQIDQVRANLDKLLNSPTAEDITLSELQVEQARQNLERATLVSPITGTVTDVFVEVGEQTTGPAAQVANLANLHVDVQIDEIDLPAIAAGQAATIILDALPEAPLPGIVSAIAPAPVPAAGGVTAYEVTVALSEQNERAKVGMTANVAIETSRREGAVIIPANLVQVEAESGQTYVEVLRANGQTVKRNVTLGNRSDNGLEVMSGLQAGEQVLVPLPKNTSKAEESSFFNGPPDGQGGAIFGGQEGR